VVIAHRKTESKPTRIQQIDQTAAAIVHAPEQKMGFGDDSLAAMKWGANRPASSTRHP